MTAAGATDAAPRRFGAISVLAWSGLESACRQILSLLFFFATARFITPADLGIFALGVALTGVVAIVIDEPIGEALVQQQTATATDWDTGYTLNITLALLCLCIAIIGSQILATLLHQPGLKFVVPALAFSSFVGAIGNIHKAYLSRLLKFRAIAQTALVGQLFGGVVSVVLAVAGFGYWALVANVLGTAMVTSLIYRIMTPWRPRYRIEPDFIRARASYVGYSISIRALYLVRDQSLFVVVGWMGSVVTVGYLSLAMRVARALGQLFEEVTSRPLISLVSRQQNDLSRFSAMLTTVLQLVGLLAFPSFVGLAAVGTPLIATLIGPQWAPAGRFLPWICIGMGGWLLLHIVAASLRARGLGRAALCLTAPTIIVDAAIFASASIVGLDWALIAWTARTVLSLPVLQQVLSGRLGVSGRALFEVWIAPVVASILMLQALRWLQPDQSLHQGPLDLATCILAAAAVYTIAWLILSAGSLRNNPLRRVAGDD
jgi:O-antigen/teichoic acid export membrane protein